MNLNDFIIDHRDFDWSQLLSSWSWLLPDEFTVWMMSRIGDLLIVTNDGAVHFLDVGRGSFNQIAATKEEFIIAADQKNIINNVLAVPIVQSIELAGLVLSKGECYSYIKLPILGGRYTPDNFVVKSAAFHFAAFGPMHEKLKDFPNGTKIHFEIIN